MRDPTLDQAPLAGRLVARHRGFAGRFASDRGIGVAGRVSLLNRPLGWQALHDRLAYRWRPAPAFGMDMPPVASATTGLGEAAPPRPATAAVVPGAALTPHHVRPPFLRRSPTTAVATPALPMPAVTLHALSGAHPPAPPAGAPLATLRPRLPGGVTRQEMMPAASVPAGLEPHGTPSSPWSAGAAATVWRWRAEAPPSGREPGASPPAWRRPATTTGGEVLMPGPPPVRVPAAEPSAPSGSVGAGASLVGAAFARSMRPGAPTMPPFTPVPFVEGDLPMRPLQLRLVAPAEARGRALGLLEAERSRSTAPGTAEGAPRRAPSQDAAAPGLDLAQLAERVQAAIAARQRRERERRGLY